MAARDVTRRLAAILTADVVEFARLMAKDEAETLQRLTALRDNFLSPLIAEHQGRVVKLMGDGWLVEFPSVVGAAACALAWQAGITERQENVAEDKALRFRIGINLGDIIVEDDDIFGDGVNVAARLEATAKPGTICVSRAVFEQINNKLDMDYTDLGPVKVKSLATPIPAYQIRPAEAERADKRPAIPAPESARGSIAVLPFESLSADPEDAYLADGIATEILDMLSRVPDLRVAARSATFGYRDQGAEFWTLVQDLKLLYVLTGSVRRAGDRVRVFAELTLTADRSQLWSHTYQRQFADLFAVQEEIAEAIVVAFGGEYMRAEWRRARSRPTASLDAWGLIQKARALNLPVNRDATDDALALAHEAIEIDPGYAGAHAAVASIVMQRVINGISNDDDDDRATALGAAERAAELMPDDPTVLRTLGNVWSNCGEHGKAVRALRRGVAIAPFDFQTWGRLGRTLAYGGDAADLTEGRAILDRILAHAPNHPMVPYWHYFKANACIHADQPEEAVHHARLSVEAQPGYAGAWLTLANALGQLGRLDAAKDAMAQARRANPAMTPAHLAQQIDILAGGRQDRADKSLSGLRAAGLL